MGFKRLVQAETSEAIFPEYPPEEFIPVEWFSNSTYAPYKDAFLIGLDLNASFPYAGECIGHSWFFVDKSVQFYNNASFEFMYTKVENLRVVYPVLNFTGMIAKDFAPIPIDCFEFGLQFYTYW